MYLKIVKVSGNMFVPYLAVPIRGRNVFILLLWTSFLACRLNFSSQWVTDDGVKYDPVIFGLFIVKELLISMAAN